MLVTKLRVMDWKTENIVDYLYTTKFFSRGVHSVDYRIKCITEVSCISQQKIKHDIIKCIAGFM